MEKINSITRKDALFAIPYDVEIFRATTEKIEKGEELPHKPKDEEVIRLATAWDYPQLTCDNVIEILKNDSLDYPQEMINTVQARAVGMVNARYVIPLIGRERYIELAKKHIKRIESDMLMTNRDMAQWWSGRKG